MCVCVCVCVCILSQRLNSSCCFLFFYFQDPGISNTIPGNYPPYDEGIKANVFIRDDETKEPIVGKVNINRYFQMEL